MTSKAVRVAQLVYKKMEEDAAQDVDTEHLELQAEEEAFLQASHLSCWI